MIIGNLKTSLIHYGPERNMGQEVIHISWDTKPGVLTGIDSVFYQNAYPVTAVAYGLYPIRDPDPANLAPLRDGDLNCVAQRVVDHFKGALRGQGLISARRQIIQEWENGVHEGGATVDDVAELVRILKRAIILRDIAGEDIYNNGKYRSRGADMELFVHNGHAWPKDYGVPRGSKALIRVDPYIKNTGQHVKIRVDPYIYGSTRTLRVYLHLRVDP